MTVEAESCHGNHRFQVIETWALAGFAGPSVCHGAAEPRQLAFLLPPYISSYNVTHSVIWASSAQCEEWLRLSLCPRATGDHPGSTVPGWLPYICDLGRGRAALLSTGLTAYTCGLT